MNEHLINHIDKWLDKAGNFVCEYMPVDIDVDTAYVELLRCCNGFDTGPMLAAFQNAVRYLPPNGMYERFAFALTDGRSANLQARLYPTKKWPTFLMPRLNVVINPQSKLMALLDTPIRVATQWVHLEFLWLQLHLPAYGLSNQQLVYLMPWIRECLADFNVGRLPVEVKPKERVAIQKELATVMDEADVPFFPRLSKELMAVARSGKTLISQYRMIDAAYATERLSHPPLTIERTKDLVEPWVREYLTEAMDDWRNDQMRRTASDLVARRLRDEKRKQKITQRVK